MKLKSQFFVLRFYCYISVKACRLNGSFFIDSRVTHNTVVIQNKKESYKHKKQRLTRMNKPDFITMHTYQNFKGKNFTSTCDD